MFYGSAAFLTICLAICLSTWLLSGPMNWPVHQQDKPRKEQTMRTLPKGGWGGAHILMSVGEENISLEFDCGVGSIAQVIALDKDGNFEALGTYFNDEPPSSRVVSIQEEIPETGETGALRPPPELPQGLAARYVGKVTEQGMVLTVMLADTERMVGSFTLKFGETPKLYKCL